MHLLNSFPILPSWFCEDWLVSRLQCGRRGASPGTEWKDNTPKWAWFLGYVSTIFSAWTVHYSCPHMHIHSINTFIHITHTFLVVRKDQWGCLHPHSNTEYSALVMWFLKILCQESESLRNIYFCTLYNHNTAPPGTCTHRLLVDKLKSLGLPPGPLYSKLKQGEAVTTPEGLHVSIV